MAATILQSPIFTDMILPFLLVFAVVFAVLEKSEILGKGKRQVDAIVAFALGLLVVSVGNAVDIINKIVPFFAVYLIVILFLIIIVGFFWTPTEWHKSAKLIVGIIAALGLVIALAFATGFSDTIAGWAKGQASDVVANVVFIIIIVGGIIAVLAGGRGSGKEEKKKD